MRRIDFLNSSGEISLGNLKIKFPEHVRVKRAWICRHTPNVKWQKQWGRGERRSGKKGKNSYYYFFKIFISNSKLILLPIRSLKFRRFGSQIGGDLTFSPHYPPPLAPSPPKMTTRIWVITPFTLVKLFEACTPKRRPRSGGIDSDRHRLLVARAAATPATLRPKSMAITIDVAGNDAGFYPYSMWSIAAN